MAPGKLPRRALPALAPMLPSLGACARAAKPGPGLAVLMPVNESGQPVDRPTLAAVRDAIEAGLRTRLPVPLEKAARPDAEVRVQLVRLATVTVAEPVVSVGFWRPAMARLDQETRDTLPAREFAFPKQRKAPLEDARHVRNAVARFDQVEGVSDVERDAAWKRIQAAAKEFGVNLKERSWRELGKPS